VDQSEERSDDYPVRAVVRAPERAWYEKGLDGKSPRREDETNEEAMEHLLLRTDACTRLAIFFTFDATLTSVSSQPHSSSKDVPAP
jgi:hypothetical protein